MRNNSPQNRRILAIVPTRQSIGYAVLEGEHKLVGWGTRQIPKKSQERAIKKVEELISHYSPRMLVLQDIISIDSRRSSVAKELTKEIGELGKASGIKVKLFSKAAIIKTFFRGKRGTKHGIAVMLCQWFPEELAVSLPPKRVAWKKEDHRMVVFEAVALALVCSLKTTKLIK